jgi:uncharacterized protein
MRLFRAGYIAMRKENAMGCGHKSQREFLRPIPTFHRREPHGSGVKSLAMKKIPRMVGVLLDTHGLLRPEAKEALRGSDLMIHAGDVGKPEIIGELQAIALLFVVRGNVDTGTWANKLPRTATVEFARASIYVLHNLHDLALDPESAGFGAVITGHSRRAHQYWQGKVLFLNPGSAGPKRFDLPVAVARLHVGKNPWSVEFIPLNDK